MPLADQLKKAAKRLAWLLEVEVAKRIDTLAWTQSGSTGAFYITPSEGEPERVRAIDLVTHAVTEYEEKASLADCQSDIGSWFFDSGTGRLYVHTTLSGAVAPSAGDFYFAAYYLKRFCDGQYPHPNELVFDGKWYDPRLKKDSIPDLSVELSGFHQGGVLQTWSDFKLINSDGALDEDLVDYIWENKIFTLKCGAPGDAYSSFVTVSQGRTGSITWDDDEITVGIEDPMKGED